MNFAGEIPEIAPLFEGADYIDVKIALGNTSLRQFIARMLSYYPFNPPIPSSGGRSNDAGWDRSKTIGRLRRLRGRGDFNHHQC